MNLEGIMLSERRQTQESTSCMIPLHEMSLKCKSWETENDVYLGLGWEWELPANRHEWTFLGDRNTLKMYCGDDFTIAKFTQKSLNCTINTGWNLMICKWYLDKATEIHFLKKNVHSSGSVVLRWGWVVGQGSKTGGSLLSPRKVFFKHTYLFPCTV